MMLNNFFANSQPNTRPGIIRLAMQPLEYLENAGSILIFKANTIIGNLNFVIYIVGGEHIHLYFQRSKGTCYNIDNRLHTFFMKLNSIVQYVGKQLFHL